jgi:hypothetical protein
MPAASNDQIRGKRPVLDSSVSPHADPSIGTLLGFLAPLDLGPRTGHHVPLDRSERVSVHLKGRFE